MKKYLAFLFCLIISISIAQNTLKYTPVNKSPKATLKQVSWIAGYWQGKALGGLTEEVWTAPMGDSMMGSFKLVVDNKVKFYELCTISELNETLILRIKHFDNDLKGWEEKEVSENFRLVKIENNKVYFDGLTFEKVGENKLNIYVVFEKSNGLKEEIKFSYTLKN
ncbi:DUF6265 family protein [Lutibacter aestuarii]|uniref:DUF6265 family protein n=2 Tax=Lutibacter TaxID=358023 RepID=A0ABW2Z7H4_9FLAO|nr:DUF6265 family protein [uncultured Lutibacter sp.]